MKTTLSLLLCSFLLLIAFTANAGPSFILGGGKQGISTRKKTTEGNEAKVEYRFSSISENLNLHPHLGLIGSSKGSAYAYTGLTFIVDFSPFHIGFSFSPGLYHRGNGKKLGHPIEFKSQLEVFYNINQSISIGTSISHRSNAGLSKINPGLNNILLELHYNF